MAQPVDFLLITRKWAPAMGGMETWSHKVAEHLGKLASLEVVALPGRTNGKPPSLFALLRFPIIALLRYFALETAPKTILLGDMAIWPLALFAKLRGRSPRIMIAAHGTDVAYPRRGGLMGRLYGFYLKIGAKLFPDAIVIANSNATAEVTREAGWLRIAVVPLATDFRPIPGPEHCEQAVLFAGRLLRHKGCLWFAENVLDQLPSDIVLKIAGTGWQSAEKAVLSHPRVQFLGRLSQRELSREYAQSLCVILPNIETEKGEQEGFGLVAAEAAAAGGIVLAADHGGLRDAVIDGSTGFLIPTGDAQAWAAAVRRVAEMTPTQRNAFTSKAAQKAATYYSWDRVAASLDELGMAA